MSDQKQLLPLCEAIKCHDLDAVKRALALGANPNGYQRNLDRPPMNEAARQNFIPALEVLHAAGGKVDGVARFDRTPLMNAASYGCLESARWLLRHGADVLIEKSESTTALACALFSNHMDIADVMLQERPSLHGRPLTSQAISTIENSLNANAFHWLLKAGVSPNLVTRSGASWLMAVQSTDDFFAPLSEMLLAAGADVNFQDGFGRTALHRSVNFKSMAAFMRLLRGGADPDLADYHGQTVRHLLNQDVTLSHMHDAFIAWEASTAAHQEINRSEPPTGVKPL